MQIIAASSDIILPQSFSHIINLIHVINTRSIRKIHVHLVKCRNKNSILKRLKVLQ